jgi:hypothetical protein
MIDPGEIRHLHIEFFIEPAQNIKKSEAEGRPIFDDSEFVRIKFVGDPKKELVAPAHDKFMRDRETGAWISYAEAYSRHYEVFKTGQAALGEGTPIEELPFITAAKRAELKALNIHTAEGLAQLDGTNLQRLGMYGRDLKNKAQVYIDDAKAKAPVAHLAAENAALRERMEALEEMLKAQHEKAAPTPVAQARRPGRPPRQVEAA